MRIFLSLNSQRSHFSLILLHSTLPMYIHLYIRNRRGSEVPHLPIAHWQSRLFVKYEYYESKLHKIRQKSLLKKFNYAKPFRKHFKRNVM